MLPMRSRLISVAVLCLFVASMPQLIVGQDESVIVEGKTQPPTVTIVGVDGRRLKAEQHQISIAPGHHRILVRITDLRRRPPASELPFDEILEANHRYTIEAQLWGDGLKYHIDKRPR